MSEYILIFRHFMLLNTELTVYDGHLFILNNKYRNKFKAVSVPELDL